MNEPRSSWIRRIWPPLPVWQRLDLSVLFICIYTAIVSAFYQIIHYQPPTWSGVTAALTALVLSPLLTFRNREAYDRWWEARKLWGQLINDSRNLMLKLKSFPEITEAERQLVRDELNEFAVTLKRRLRREPSERHLPLEGAGKIYQSIQTWRARGAITDMQVLWLDPHVRGLMDVCGACERILQSPIPQSYRALLRHGLVLYLVSAPWFVADQLGYWSVPAIGILTYFLLGIELTAEVVENPFGTEGDDLELASYCETIRRSLDQIVTTPVS